MANWSNPLLTSTYTNFLTEVKDRDTDLALQFDGTTSTNIPTNTIRWNSSINRWQKWNGTAWGELTATYALTALTTTGTIAASGSVTGTALIPSSSTIPVAGIFLPAANTLGFATATTERLRIDSSGRVGIGTSSPQAPLHVLTSTNKDVRIADASHTTLTTGLSSAITLSRVSDGTGSLSALFGCNNGGIALAARESIVFATGGTGTYSDTLERLRIDSNGTVIYNQPTPAAVDVTATLTVANLTAKIITSSTAAAVTMTLPTGTLMDGGFSSLYTNMAFEWSVINTGATNAVTVQGGTGHTVVGSDTVAANNSVRFLSRRTAATTWVTYRVS